MTRAFAPAFTLLVFAAPVAAHYNMLMPSSASVRKGEAVALLYQWGHPFEHQLFDAPAPRRLMVIAPDGKKTDLTKSLDQTAVNDGKEKRSAYRLRFTPEQRGDFVFVLETPPIWMAEEEEFYQDTVKVVLHVQAQKGWDAAAGTSFELTPLTRPYGLVPGMVFQAQAWADGARRGGGLGEFERYNALPPKELPADEFVTRTARADGGGVITGTLTEPGWWAITVQSAGGQQEHNGKQYPLRRRATFWVFVNEKAK